jgi:hypothetical protein
MAGLSAWLIEAACNPMLPSGVFGKALPEAPWRGWCPERLGRPAETLMGGVPVMGLVGA